jgi:hypothetical protein
MRPESCSLGAQFSPISDIHHVSAFFSFFLMGPRVLVPKNRTLGSNLSRRKRNDMSIANLKQKRKWSEMTESQKGIAIVTVAVQLTMAVFAWRDLARRSNDEVRGPKWRWAVAIGANFFGPIAYYRRGRVTS